MDEYIINRDVLYKLIKDHLYARVYRQHSEVPSMKKVFYEVGHEHNISDDTIATWLSVDDAVNFLIDWYCFADGFFREEF